VRRERGGALVEEIRALAGASRVPDCGARVERTSWFRTHPRARAATHRAARRARVLRAAVGEHSLIGTTDVDDATPPERIAASEEDIRYLWRRPCGPSPSWPRAGGRSRLRRSPLPRAGSAILPWANSREHRIIEEGTMLTLIGGKYTTHRSLAERVVDRVGARHPRARRPVHDRGVAAARRMDAIAKLGAQFRDVSGPPAIRSRSRRRRRSTPCGWSERGTSGTCSRVAPGSGSTGTP